MFFILSNYKVINCAQRARYGLSNRIESYRKIYRLIESIKFHINDITRNKPVPIVDWYRLKGCPKSRSTSGTINAVPKVDRLLVQLVLYQKSIDFWYK